MALIIGLIADAPGSGKSTAAFALHALRDHSYLVPFAGPLKAMIEVLLRQAGLTDAEVRRLMVEAKQEEVRGLGYSTRRMMQTLGTEWGRQSLDPEFWVRLWRNRVQSLQRGGIARLILADDVRFLEEAEAIRRMGGELWRIQRRDCIQLDEEHASEGGLSDVHVDQTIDNNGTIKELCQQLRICLEQAERRHAAAAERVGVALEAR